MLRYLLRGEGPKQLSTTGKQKDADDENQWDDAMTSKKCDLLFVAASEGPRTHTALVIAPIHTVVRKIFALLFPWYRAYRRRSRIAIDHARCLSGRFT